MEKKNEIIDIISQYEDRVQDITKSMEDEKKMFSTLVKMLYKCSDIVSSDTFTCLNALLRVRDNYFGLLEQRCLLTSKVYTLKTENNID